MFTLHLAQILGFKFHGHYQAKTPVLDLQEGNYTSQTPVHPYYLEGEAARMTYEFTQLGSLDEAKTLTLSQNNRRDLLKYYQQFFSLHIENYIESKSYKILQTVLQ